MGKGGWREGCRIILWMAWVTNMLITSIYYCLSFVTCNNLVKSYRDLKIPISNEIWRAPLAASALAGVLVLLFNLLSCFILIRKSINKSGPGFGYGFIVAFCFTLAFFCLLCGLVLDGFQDVVKNQLESLTVWGQYNTGQYIATVVFSYICFAMLILFFLALVLFQGAVTDELGISGKMYEQPYGKLKDGPMPQIPVPGEPTIGVGNRGGEEDNGEGTV